MKRGLGGLCAVGVLALALAGCHNEAGREKARAEAASRASAALSETVAALTTTLLHETPELATRVGASEAEAGGPYSDRLSDLSKEGFDRLADREEAIAENLFKIDRGLLSGEDAITFDVAKATLARIKAGASFGYGVYGGAAPKPYVVSQLTGSYQVTPGFLAHVQPLGAQKDGEDYLARLAAFARQIDQETARIKEDAAHGVTPPAFIIDRTLDQISALADAPAPATSLVRTLEEGVGGIEGLAPVRAAELTRRAIDLVRDGVQPALHRQSAALKALRAKAGDEPGVGRLPNGAAYYAAALAGWTTLEVDPADLHKTGLDLVAQYTSDMDELLKANGLKTGSVAERIKALSSRKDQLYSNDDKGRAQLVADLNDRMSDIEARLPEIVLDPPKARLEIKRAPQNVEQSAPGGVYSAAANGRPATFYINLGNTRSWPKFALTTFAYHEGVPGHHLQNAIAERAKGLPLLRTDLLDFGGYREGWAVYAEQLADEEFGAYAKDPLGRLGYLQSMTLRAARLVVDTGVHAQGWSRKQALDYLSEATGQAPTSLEAEIDRYVVWPGQACAYMVGREEFNRLRDKARAALGDKFDIRAFHEAVLREGPMPLSTLGRLVDDWIAEQKAKA